MELVKDLNDRLLFAVPKKGRLAEKVLDLIRGCDIKFYKPNRLDIALVQNLPIALVFVPASEIPRLVARGRIDLGITGQDIIAEYAIKCPFTADKGVDEIIKLPFGSCKLQVQVPEVGEIQTAEQLVGKTICTSFPALAEKYFSEVQQAGPAEIRSLKTDVDWSGGSVESSIALGSADGIVDLVESGDTMRAHGLKAISTIMESSAVLIQSRRSTNQELIKKISSRIRGVLTAKQYVLCTYNVPRDKLPAVSIITPGQRAPTITPLDLDGWVAVNVMVERKKIAEVMDQLEEVGAEDILVRAIENARTNA